MSSIYASIENIRRKGKKAAFCLITDAKGSAPRKRGAKMIVFADGSIQGTVGGGSLEMRTIHDALAVMEEGRPVKRTYNLSDELAMGCGGVIEMYIEPIQPELKLYIFGAGHVGRAVADYAPDFDFQVTLFDCRDMDITVRPEVNLEHLGKEYAGIFDEIPFDRSTFIMIATHSHDSDEALLEICAKKEFAYLGMIGSRKKIAQIRNNLLSGGKLSEEELDRINMPIGLPFRAVTPREIGVSILAQMIDVKNSIAQVRA